MNTTEQMASLIERQGKEIEKLQAQVEAGDELVAACEGLNECPKCGSNEFTHIINKGKRECHKNKKHIWYPNKMIKQALARLKEVK